MKKTIYVFSPGALKRKGNTLCLVGVDGKKKYLPVSEVSSLMIFGETTFNKRLLEFLSSNEITLHIFNYYGYYVGSFYPRTHYNSGFMTLKQCEHYLDSAKRLALARKFVEGSLKNMLKNVTYYHNRKGGLLSTMNFLEEALRKLDEVNSVEELMAIEGRSKEQYYSSFNIIIDDATYHYEKRERRPPKSRLDTLLSFGNSLLYVTILGEIYKTHLDPRIGFLHTTNYRKFSLNLDVAEVFKPVIVDRVIFTLTNKKMLDPSCFMKELEGVYLNENGRKVFVEQYENKLKQTISYGKRMRASYQRIIRLELYKLEKHLIGEKMYEPFTAQW
ncbi:MAG: type I-B CRISPR-associated endonuclease Cas1b [Nitrososphaerota archaeon]|nr:type I-B CRISPR-associated endonuclease Cas1b [Candidatus Bathyarchaeota archaeon]MDW8022598.1 type I-B CRISPR-associated endonuclease Cas1b [Nitrososphaerota archaeon]